MTQDEVMRMSTEQLRRELKRLQAEEDNDGRIAGEIALIQYELYRRDLHGGDWDIDYQ